MARQDVAKTKRSLKWIDIEKATKKDRAELEADFDFLESDLDDAFGTTTRSKLVRRKKYILLVLTVPRFDDDAYAVAVDHMSFFILPKALITIHHAPIAAMSALFDDCTTDKHTRGELLGGTVDTLLLEVLQQVLENTFPITDRITDDVEELKRSIFEGQYNRNTIEEILIIRRNITDLRGALRGYPDALQHLLKPNPVKKTVIQEAALFESLIDDTYENWAELESLKEAIEALEDANESLLSHDLNDTMRMLTVISVLLLPAAVIAGVFGMNARNMPFIGHPMDFWLIIGIILSISVVLIVFFYARRRLN